MNSSFHSDTKFCPCCNDYVRYLQSLDTAYCVECGGVVRLLSGADWSAFQAKMEERKNKGGRPRKGAGRRGRRSAAA